MKIAGIQHRALSLDRSTLRANGDDRTISLAFVSEAPVSRWWGEEILSVDAQSMRTERLRNRAPLLLDHDPRQVVGVVEQVIVGKDRIGRASVRFSRNALADEVWRDIVDEIRGKVSIGYRILDLVLESKAGDVSTYRVTDFEVYEISIVGIAADDRVGVGRSISSSQTAGHVLASTGVTRMDRTELHDEQDPRNLLSRRERKLAASGDLDTELEQRAERARIESIKLLGSMWPELNGPELARSAVLDGNFTADEFRKLLLQKSAAQAAPITRTAALEDDRVAYGSGARETFAPTRLRCFTTEKAAHAFGVFIRAQLPGNARDQRWLADNYGQRALSSLGGSAGTLVPEEVSSQLIKNLDSFGVARREAMLWPMGSDSLRVPTNTSRPSASFTAAGTEVPASDPGFSGVELSTKSLMAQTQFARETADDSVIALGEYVGSLIVESFAEKEDSCLFVGDGTSTYGGMMGLNAALLAGSQITATGHDLLSELDATDFSSVIGALPEYAQPGAKWYCSRAVYGASMQRLMIAAGGNTYRSIEAGPSANLSFAGFPVVLSPKAPSGVATDFTGIEICYFGDMRRTVAFGDRQTISLMVDPYTLAGKGQLRVVGYERFDLVIHGVGTASEPGPMIAMIGGT